MAHPIGTAEKEKEALVMTMALRQQRIVRLESALKDISELGVERGGKWCRDRAIRVLTE
jgi:hypothetical protein